MTQIYLQRPPYLGAVPVDRAWNFSVWAPKHQRLELHLLGKNERLVPMQRDPLGYHTVIAEGVEAGAKYFYRFEAPVGEPSRA